MAEEIKNEEVIEETAPAIDWEAEAKRLKAELDKQKSATSNASSDAAEWKRKYRATQDEATRAAEEQKEAIDALRAENENYKKQGILAKNTQGFMSIGYDSDTAAFMASSLNDVMPEDFFGKQKAFLENQKKAVEAEMLNRQPKPTPGKPIASENIESAQAAAFRKAARGW